MSTPRPIPALPSQCSTGPMSPLLPRILPGPDGKPSPQNNTAAAFRAFDRDLATGRRPWTTQAAGYLSDLSDQLAGSRDSDQVTGRDDPLHDALARGGPFLEAPAWKSAPAPACSPPTSRQHSTP